MSDAVPAETATPSLLSWGAKFAFAFVLTLVVGGLFVFLSGPSQREQDVCADRAAGFSDYQIAMELSSGYGWSGSKSLEYAQAVDC